MCSGCSLLTTDYTITKRSAIDEKIAAARVESESKLNELNQKQVATLNQTIASHVQREQTAADYLFKGLAVSGTLKSPTRPEMVMGQSIQQTSAYLPPATPAAQVATLKALQIELDEAKISAEALKTQYEQELNVARATGEAKAKELQELNTKLQTIETERVEVLTKASKIERDLQETKDKIQDTSLAQQKLETERAKSVQAIKVKLSAIVGGLALLCVAGAIWSPIGKSKFGLAAVILGLTTAAIWYVQPWHVALGAGIALFGLIGWAVKNGYIENRAATNTYRAIQRVKEKSKDEYDRLLKPELAAWQTTYTSDGKTVPDAAAIQHIDKVLKETGDL